MADEPRPMSQEEIDALFANLGKTGGDEPTPPAAADEASAAEVAEVEDASAAESAVEAVGDEAAAAAGPALDTSAADALDSEGAGLEQDDIDALLGDLNAGGEAAMTAQGGPMSQEGIDALLGQLGDDMTPKSKPATQVLETSMGQSDIDVLLDDINSGRETETPAGGPMDQAGIDALLGDLNDTVPAAATDAASSAPAANAAMDQAGIDALLAQVAAGGSGPDPGRRLWRSGSDPGS